MPHLNQIYHKNKNTEEKVNFFSDYFNFLNIRLGEFKELPFENQLSLIEKSIYQIENNLQKSTPYLKNYLSNGLLNPDGFISRFTTSKIVTAQIEEYLSLNDKMKKKWINQNPDFLVNLRLLQVELKDEMLNEALSSLISFLRCKHKLVTHIKLIKECTNIIVSEFKYRNHSKKDIKEVISQIMSNDINKFPFPKEITNNKHNGDYEELREEFIKNRNFVAQFNGIKNLFEKEKQELFFIFKINNISAKKYPEFEFKYDKVTFISPNHKLLKELIKTLKDKDFLKDFFKRKNNFILAYTKESIDSIEKAYERAEKLVITELKYLNSKLKYEGIIDRYFHLQTRDFINAGGARKYEQKIKEISDYANKKLNDNLFKYLNKTQSSQKATLEYFEHQFQEAYREKNITGLWQYLENITPLNDKEDKQVKNIVSNLLTLGHRKKSKETLSFDFTNAVSPWSIAGKEIGLKPEDQRFIVQNRNQINPLHYQRKIKRPFLNEIFKLYKLHASKKNLLKERDYYYSLINEAYEFRNMEVHKGVVNHKIELKLKNIFPKLVMRFRILLIEKCTNSNSESFEKMIIELDKTATKIIQN